MTDAEKIAALLALVGNMELWLRPPAGGPYYCALCEHDEPAHEPTCEYVRVVTACGGTP